jgi:LCP family protein required for cell wall assembly
MSSENKKPKRTLYDYSRSDAGNHWYNHTEDPLRRQRDDDGPSAERKPKPDDYQPDRTKTAVPTRQTRARQRVERRQQLRIGVTQDNWVVIVIAGVLFGLTALVVMLLAFVVGGDGEDGGGNIAAAAIEPTSAIYGAEGDALEDANALLIEPWQGGERLTMLLMGMDTRPDESDLICRTDTILVISIDPGTRRIGMLSIPRDTYVEVPGYDGLRKINTACVIGNLEAPGNGPRLAMQTIQYNFGIRVNEYMLVNFDAFTSIIDRIGGVEVVVSQTIDDQLYPDEFYGYDPFYIEAGTHLMDGETALKYARSRNTTDDIDRGRRQQQIIFAMRDRVLSLDMVDTLAAQSLNIWNDVEGGIETSLSVNQMVELGLYAAEIDLANISNTVLGWEYLRAYIGEDGEEYLIPDRSKLAPLMTEIFGPGYND